MGFQPSDNHPLDYFQNRFGGSIKTDVYLENEDIKTFYLEGNGSNL
jgi:hypothetical protein